MKKFLILISFLAAFSATAYVSICQAETKTQSTQKQLVCFTVVDGEGNPIPFATVLVKGTNRGVTTDLDGSACIELNPGETLIISAIGYKTIEFVYIGQQPGRVTLREDC